MNERDQLLEGALVTLSPFEQQSGNLRVVIRNRDILGPFPFQRSQAQALQLLAHVEDAALVADAQMIPETATAAKDAGIFKMHVRALSGLIRFDVLLSHFPHFMAFGLRKRLAALFASHVDGALNAPLVI